MNRSDSDRDLLMWLLGLCEGILSVQLEGLFENVRQRVEKVGSGAFLGVHARHFGDPTDPPAIVLTDNGGPCGLGHVCSPSP